MITEIHSCYQGREYRKNDQRNFDPIEKKPKGKGEHHDQDKQTPRVASGVQDQVLNNIVAAEWAVDVSKTGSADDDKEDHSHGACGGMTYPLNKVFGQTAIKKCQHHNAESAYCSGLTWGRNTHEDRAFDHCD